MNVKFLNPVKHTIVAKHRDLKPANSTVKSSYMSKDEMDAYLARYDIKPYKRPFVLY